MTEAMNQAGSAPEHPASAGLRQMADELDVLAAGGCTPGVELEIRLSRENFATVCRVLRLQMEAIPPNKRKEGYHMVNAKRRVGPLHVRGWAWLQDLATKRVAMKRVEEFVFSDKDLIALDQAGSAP